MFKAAPADLGRQRGELGRQLHRRHVGGVEEAVVERQRHHLLVGGVGQLLAAVTRVHAPQAAHRVQNLRAFGVPHVDVVGPRDHARATRGQAGVVGERVQVVRAVQRLDGFRVLLLRTANQGGRGDEG